MSAEPSGGSKLDLNVVNVADPSNGDHISSIRNEFNHANVGYDMASVRFQRSLEKYAELVDHVNQFKLYNGSNLLSVSGYGCKSNNEALMPKKPKK